MSGIYNTLLPIKGKVYRYEVGKRGGRKQTVFARFEIVVTHIPEIQIKLKWSSVPKFPDLISLQLNAKTLDITEVVPYLVQCKNILWELRLDLVVEETVRSLTYRKRVDGRSTYVNQSLSIRKGHFSPELLYLISKK